MASNQLNLDDRTTIRIPIKMAWAFAVALVLGAFIWGGLWFQIGAIPDQIKEFRTEYQQSTKEMKERQDKVEDRTHHLEIEVKGIKTKLGITATFSDSVVTAAN